MTDPFKPIPRAPHLKVVATGEFELVSPVPIDAPPLPETHANLGKAVAVWTYRDAAGRLLGHVARYSTPTGKEFRPWALWRSRKDGSLRWRNQLWPAPRPLYNLEKLAARPSARVVVCEGEKATDAAARLLTDFVCITAPGGANAVSKADLAPLAGRSVVVWRDNDEAGAKQASDVAAAAKAAGALDVAVAQPPPGVSQGWDAADAEAEGWTREQAAKFIASASPVGATAKDRAGAEGKATAGRKKRGAGAVIDLVNRAEVELWCDQAGNAYVTFQSKGHRENHRIQSKEFARWIAILTTENGVSAPNASALSDVFLYFEARAFAGGVIRKPIRRVGEFEGALVVDMCDERWRVFVVTARGWEIVENCRAPVVRSASMLALPEPMPTDESIDLFRRHVNADDSGFKLIVAWLLASLAPNGPRPILILNGEQGTAKSTLSRFVRQLCDPNVAPLRTLPRDPMDLAVLAQHAHVQIFDNMSGMSGEVSDMLCRMATGGAVGVRAKYSNADEVVLMMNNAIIANGIASLTNRPDLASRALVVRLKPIAEDERLTERELEADWAEVAPRVLAILLDALAAARAALPTIKLARASRMADFETLIEAAAPSLGWEPGEFGVIYRENQHELDGDAIEADSVALAIVAVMADHLDGWAGSATRLLERLAEKTSETVRRSREWPANPISFGTRLERLKPVLRRHGISIERKHSGDRLIYLSRISPPQPQPPASDGP